MKEGVGDREGELPVLPGDGHRHRFSGDRLGKELGERKRHAVRIDVEKRDPQPVRQNPSLCVGVEEAGKERCLHRRDALPGAEAQSDSVK